MTDPTAKIREQLEAKSFVATVFESVSHAVDYRVVRLSDAIALLDAKRPSECHWSGDEFTSDWYGDCGIEFTFIDGTPTENEMIYCPKCGGKLIDDGYPKSENDDEETP